MNDHKLFSSLVTMLDQRRETILNAEHEPDRRKLFRTSCEEVLAQFAGVPAENLRNIIDNLLTSGDNTIHAIIEDILEEYRPAYRTQIELREQMEGFDSTHGTVTAEILEQFELDESVSFNRFVNSNGYHPSPVSSVKMILDRLPDYGIAYENHMFVDVGSGMGRNLLLASEYPFERIIGLEISQKLHEIARENIKIYTTATQKCRKIDLYCLNALNYTFPAQNLVLYFWNPFDRGVSNLFTKRLAEFVRHTGVNVSLIFLEHVFPAIKDIPLFRLQDCFETDAVIGGEAGHYKVTIYRAGNTDCADREHLEISL